MDEVLIKRTFYCVPGSKRFTIETAKPLWLEFVDSSGDKLIVNELSVSHEEDSWDISVYLITAEHTVADTKIWIPQGTSYIEVKLNAAGVYGFNNVNSRTYQVVLSERNPTGEILIGSDANVE